MGAHLFGCPKVTPTSGLVAILVYSPLTARLGANVERCPEKTKRAEIPEIRLPGRWKSDLNFILIGKFFALIITRWLMHYQASNCPLAGSRMDQGINMSRNPVSKELGNSSIMLPLNTS